MPHPLWDGMKWMKEKIAFKEQHYIFDSELYKCINIMYSTIFLLEYNRTAIPSILILIGIAAWVWLALGVRCRRGQVWAWRYFLWTCTRLVRWWWWWLRRGIRFSWSQSHQDKTKDHNRQGWVEGHCEKQLCRVRYSDCRPQRTGFELQLLTRLWRRRRRVYIPNLEL